MRDVAYWPKTFLDEVERRTVERGVRFWALGGPSLIYRTPETMIWIDPYFYGTPDDAVPDAYRAVAIPINPEEVRVADLLISTHDHVDHCLSVAANGRGTSTRAVVSEFKAISKYL